MGRACTRRVPVSVLAAPGTGDISFVVCWPTPPLGSHAGASCAMGPGPVRDPWIPASAGMTELAGRDVGMMTRCVRYGLRHSRQSRHSLLIRHSRGSGNPPAAIATMEDERPSVGARLRHRPAYPNTDACVRADASPIESTRHHTPSQRVKLKLLASTLCLQGCFLVEWPNCLITRTLCHEEQPFSGTGHPALQIWRVEQELEGSEKGSRRAVPVR